MSNNIVYRVYFLVLFVVHNLLVVTLDNFFIMGRSNSFLNVLILFLHGLFIFLTLHKLIRVSRIFTENEIKVNENLSFNFITLIISSLAAFLIAPDNFGFTFKMPDLFQNFIGFSGAIIIFLLLIKNKMLQIRRLYFEVIFNFLIFGLILIFKNDAIFFLGIKVVHFTYFHVFGLGLKRNEYLNLVYFLLQTLAFLILMSLFIKFNLTAFGAYIFIQLVVVFYLNQRQRSLKYN